MICRWTVGDGKRLAQTPHKPLTFYERVRLEKQQKAAIQTPLVQGYRLLPEFTPGRAMLWGTILAVWGTAAIVASTAKSLDIKTVRAKQAALALSVGIDTVEASFHCGINGKLVC